MKTFGDVMTILGFILLVLGAVDYFVTEYLPTWAIPIVVIVAIVLAVWGSNIKRNLRQKQLFQPGRRQ